MARDKRSHKFKILEGRASEAKLEALPEPARRWNCPSWLGREGCAFHKRYFPMAQAMGTVSEADKSRWFLMAQRYYRILQYEAILDKDGPVVSGRGGELKRHPVSSMLKSELDLFRKETATFGLDPKARDQMGIDLPKGPPSVMQQLVDW